MADALTFQPAKRGDTFRAGVTTAEVVRVSRAGTWVDIYVTDAGGFSWGKRMPQGIPSSWTPTTGTEEQR